MTAALASRALPARWTDVRGARLLVAIALLKGLVIAFLVPPFQAPDEYGHYDYAVYLSKVSPSDFLLGRFQRPVTLVQQAIVTREIEALAEATGTSAHLSDAIVPGRVPLREMLARGAAWSEADERHLPSATTWSGLMNYPPLYYAAAGSVLRAQRAAGVNPVVRFYSVRLFSLALFLLALVAASAALARLGASGLWKSVTLAAIALQPQLSMLSVSVQPDILGLLLVTVAIAVLLDQSSLVLGVLQDSRLTTRNYRGFLSTRVNPGSEAVSRPLASSAVAFGAVLGALALTKSHFPPPLVAAAAVSLAWSVRLKQRTWRQAAGWLAISLALAAVIGGWWYVRSALLFDNWLGLSGWLAGPGDATWGENLATWWRLGLPMTFRSYWGTWGWFDYGVAHWMIGPLAAVSLLPAAMIAMALAAWWSERPAGRLLPASPATAVWLVPIVAGLAFAAEMIGIGAAMGLVQGQGRHWLAYALPQAMYLAAPVALAGGAGAAMAAWARRRRAGLRIAMLLAVLVAAAGASASVARIPAGWLEADVELTGDGLATAFADSGFGFNAAEHASKPLRRRDGVARVRFPLYGAAVDRLRIDVTSPGAAVRVSRASLAGANRMSTPVSLRDATVMQGAVSVEASDEALAFAVTDTGTAIVEIPLQARVRVGGGWLGAAQQPAWAAWGRAWRRWPAATGITWLWPTALVLAVLFRATSRERPAVKDPRWPVALAAGLLFVLVAMNVWLALETWTFYAR